MEEALHIALDPIIRLGLILLSEEYNLLVIRTTKT